MPTSTMTTWTCSRCGVADTRDPNTTPPAWRLVKIEHYDEGVARDYTGDFCGDCRNLLIRFLEGAAVVTDD